MANNLNLGEKISLSGSGRGLTRREWVQRMLAGAGMSFAAPAIAEAHWAAAAASADAGTDLAGEWKPAFFDELQNQSLMALAERIVPGSTGAQVNRFLDTALAASTQESQKKFVASLNVLEGEALRQFTKPFKELSAGQQDEILTTASTAQPPHPSLSPAGGAASATPPPAAALRDYFEHLKGWISVAYYSSEVGMKELGWTGESFFESFPGCEHAGGHS
jgi:hypothetical protein